MVGLLDVFDQLIQTPLKLTKRQRTKTRKREKIWKRKGAPSKKDEAGGGWGGCGRPGLPGLTCAIAGRRREGRR